MSVTARAMRWGLQALLAAFALEGILRLNGFSLLEPDSPGYLFGARSLATFQGYRDIDHVGSPLHTFRPPGLSLLLAPMAGFAPYSVLGAKLVVLAAAVAAVFLTVRLAARGATEAGALVAGLAVASSPYALLHATEIVTEFPYLACATAAILLMTRSDHPPSRRELMAAGALLTFLPFLRTIGLALVVATLAWCVLNRSRRAFWPAPVAALATTALWMVRNASAGGPTYVGAISAELKRTGSSAFAVKAVSAAGYYGAAFIDVLLPGVSLGRPLYERMTVGGTPDLGGLFGFGLLIGVAAIAAAAIGAWTRRKRDGGLIALYAALFLFVLAIYPPRHERLTWPLVPIVLALVPAGLAVFPRAVRLGAFGVALGLTVWQGAASFAMVRDNLAWMRGAERFYAERVPPMYFADWRAAGTWLHQHAPPRAAVLTRHSDVGFTSGLSQDGARFEELSPQAWRSRIAKLHARYLVVPATLYGKFFPFELLGSDPAYSYAVRFKGGDVAIIEVQPNRTGRVNLDAPASEDDAASCIRLEAGEPGRVDLATRCAELLAASGHGDEAIARLTQLAAKAGADVRIQVALGQLYLDRGDNRRASAAFEAAARLPEADLLEQTITRGGNAAVAPAAASGNPLAGVRANMDALRFREAKSGLDRALAAAPDDPALLSAAGELHTRLGLYDQALTFYRRAAERGSPQGAARGEALAAALAVESSLGTAAPAAIVRTAGFWASGGAPGRALDVLERAHAEGSGDPEIASRLGEVRRFYGLE